MVTIEEQLAAALTEGSDHLQLPVGAARKAWRRGRRRHHQLVAVSAGVGLVVAGATTAGVVTVEAAQHLRVGTTRPQTLVRSAESPSSAPNTTCPPSEMIGPIPHPDAALEAICLPNPAPGFPLRRGPDTTTMTGGGLIQTSALTRTFLVGVTPPITTIEANGTILSTPTGPEATVVVARDGAFPTTPEAVGAAGVYPVVATTAALGMSATIVQVEAGEIGVLVSADGFAVAAYGSAPAQLVTLINSLQGLPGN
jgi:hypothetical protein